MVLRYETKNEARIALARVASQTKDNYSFEIIDEKEFAETWKGRRLVVPARFIDGEYVFK
jgi:hypothetical protein